MTQTPDASPYQRELKLNGDRTVTGRDVLMDLRKASRKTGGEPKLKLRPSSNIHSHLIDALTDSIRD